MIQNPEHHHPDPSELPSKANLWDKIAEVAKSDDWKHVGAIGQALGYLAIAVLIAERFSG